MAYEVFDTAISMVPLHDCRPSRGDRRFVGQETSRAALATSKKIAADREMWGSAFVNAALLNGPAFLRANKGEEPRIFTLKNAVADTAVGVAWYATSGVAPILLGMMIGGAAIVEYQRKKQR